MRGKPFKIQARFINHLFVFLFGFVCVRVYVWQIFIPALCFKAFIRSFYFKCTKNKRCSSCFLGISKEMVKFENFNIRRLRGATDD